MGNEPDFSKMSLDELEAYRASLKNLHNTSSEKDDYIVVPDEELGSPEKIGYNKFPSVIKKYITVNIAILAASFGIEFFCITKGWLTLWGGVAFLLIQLFFGFKILGYKNIGAYDRLLAFEGMVYSCSEHGIKGINKTYTVTLYNEEQDKFLSFNYIKPVSLALPATLYLNKNTKITLGSNGPTVDSYVAVKFSPKFDEKLNEELEQGVATADKYLNHEK
jgi:hypothetical protein